MFPNVRRRLLFAFVFFVVFGVCLAAGGPAPAAIATVVLPPPANDNPAGATSITSLPFDAFVNTTWATFDPLLEPPPLNCAYDWNVNRTIWYKYTHPGDAPEQLLSTGLSQANFEAVMAVYEGEPDPNSAPFTCKSFYYFPSGSVSFLAEPGQTYYIQVGGTWGGGGALHFTLDLAPDPVAQFNFWPSLPSFFDNIGFENHSYDPAEVQAYPPPGVSTNIETESWDFGDGATVTQDYRPPWEPTYHNYAADGDYTVELEVITTDGRSNSTSQVVSVKTHDVAITKFETPERASPGQTHTIVVGINNKRYEEIVEVALYKSLIDPPGYGWSVFIGKSIQTVAVQQGKHTTNFVFNYTFTDSDLVMGKVTFRAFATIRQTYGEYSESIPDALPADNEIIAFSTKITSGGGGGGGGGGGHGGGGGGGHGGGGGGGHGGGGEGNGNGKGDGTGNGDAIDEYTPELFFPAVASNFRGARTANAPSLFLPTVARK